MAAGSRGFLGEDRWLWRGRRRVASGACLTLSWVGLVVIEMAGQAERMVAPREG